MEISDSIYRYKCRWNISLSFHFLGMQFALPFNPSYTLRTLQFDLLSPTRRTIRPQHLYSPFSFICLDDPIHPGPNSRHYRLSKYTLVHQYLIHAIRSQWVVLPFIPMGACGPCGGILDNELGSKIRCWLGGREWGGGIWNQDERSKWGE